MHFPWQRSTQAPHNDLTECLNAGWRTAEAQQNRHHAQPRGVGASVRCPTRPSGGSRQPEHQFPGTTIYYTCYPPWYGRCPCPPLFPALLLGRIQLRVMPSSTAVGYFMNFNLKTCAFWPGCITLCGEKVLIHLLGSSAARELPLWWPRLPLSNRVAAWHKPGRNVRLGKAVR